MNFRHLRLPRNNGPLPSCINWKWVECTPQGMFKAHYCFKGKCKDLGVFKSAEEANREVIKEMQAHLK